MRKEYTRKEFAKFTYSANQDNLKIADFCLKETITVQVRRAVKRRLDLHRWPGAIGNDYFLALPSIAFSTTSLGRAAAFNKAFRAVEPASLPILSAA